MDEFDDFVALIHCLLDERVACQRADDIDARHIALVATRDLRNCRGQRAGKAQADRFEELARRYGAESRENAMTLDDFLALGRLQLHAQRQRASLRAVAADALDGGFIAAVETAARIADGRDHCVQIALLRAAELLAAI